MELDGPVWLIIGALLASPAIGVVVAKYFRPNATPLEVLDQVQEERATAITERDKATLRAEASERREQVMQDYAHELRAHISAGGGPPPPPWPQGARA